MESQAKIKIRPDQYYTYPEVVEWLADKNIKFNRYFWETFIKDNEKKTVKIGKTCYISGETLCEMFIIKAESLIRKANGQVNPLK